MKISLILKVSLVALLLVLGIFLNLSYKTMYKQNNSISILEYHNLTSEQAMITQWTVFADDFNNQMFYLSQNFHVVPLKTLLEDIEMGRPIPERTVAVTFDDGYISISRLAYPILEKYQIPATMFVIGDYTEKGNGVTYQAMRWDDLKAMASSNLIDIESHTYDQPHTKPTPQETKEDYDQRIKSDLLMSRQVTKARLGTDTYILSWPFGAYTQQTNKLAREAGFTYMLGHTGYCNPTTNVENISRIIIPGGIGLEEFVKLVNPPKVNYFQATRLELERIKLKLTMDSVKKTIP